MRYGYAGYGAFGDTQADAQAYFERIMHGDTDAVVAELQAKDATERQAICDEMGRIALEWDVQQATSTGTVAYDGANNVINVCSRAGAVMPSPVPNPVPTPTPTPTPAPVQQAGISKTGWVLVAALGVGALWFAFK